MPRALAIALGLMLACASAEAAYTPPSSSTILKGTTSAIGGSALLAGACATGTASVPGSTVAMVVVVSPAANPGGSIQWEGLVTAAGVVTVSVCAIVAATPTATTYNVRVIP